MIVVPEDTRSRATPSHLQDINKPRAMPRWTVATTTFPEEIWSLIQEAPLSGHLLQPRQQLQGVTFSINPPAMSTLSNKTGISTTAPHKPLEWQSRQLNIHSLQILTMVVTSSQLDRTTATPRTHMIAAGCTRTALPTLHQRALHQQSLLLSPITPLPGVREKTVSATVASAVAIKDFPLGFVLAYPHPGFIQRPALFWRFSLL